MTRLVYFAWQHEVWECEVLSNILRDDVEPPAWYVLVRPSVAQRRWLSDHPKATQLGLQFGPNGAVAIPQSIVRDSRAEAESDVSIRALKDWDKS